MTVELTHEELVVIHQALRVQGRTRILSETTYNLLARLPKMEQEAYRAEHDTDTTERPKDNDGESINYYSLTSGDDDSDGDYVEDRTDD